VAKNIVHLFETVQIEICNTQGTPEPARAFALIRQNFDERTPIQFACDVISAGKFLLL
jgi:hypothetical protein